MRIIQKFAWNAIRFYTLPIKVDKLLTFDFVIYYNPNHNWFQIISIFLALMNCDRKLSSKIIRVSFAGLCIFVFWSYSQISNAQVIPRDTWPESWFHPHKTASELGITKFKQSPVLDEAVAKGDIPPVEERLPKDPPVIEPYKIGRYGGTAIVFTRSSFGEADMLSPPARMLIMDPELKEILPHFVKGWEFKNDGKTLILHFREGMKWSDGVPYGPDDWLLWYNQVLLNKEMMSYTPRRWKLGGEIVKLEKIDDYTLAFHSAVPNPYLINMLAQGLDVKWNSPPAHYLKPFHPDFVDKEELIKEAKEHGRDRWTDYFGFRAFSLDDDEAGTPVMRPFVTVEETPTLIVLERNPFYPFIDTEGNQLPYIDRIQVHKVQDEEMMTAKAATGQATFAGHATKTSDIPLFKLYEEKSGYKTYIWRRIHAADVTFQFNFNALISVGHPDTELREIFWDLRFRKAMSLAINRDEINKVVYFGHAVPCQTTVLPTSKFYEEKFARSYAQYDPEEAKRLLDEMGMVDVDGDGIREKPNGEPFKVTLEWTPMETPKELITELVTDQWRNVGIDISLKNLTNANFLLTRVQASLPQMGLWHADRCTDILFPVEPYWFVPMHIYQENTAWNEWTRWLIYGHTNGEEPPQVLKDLFNWWEEMNTTFDEERRLELGKKILQSQSENLWTVGTVGIAPHPLIVSNSLKNVPPNGYWGWDGRWSAPYYPETWYLVEKSE